MIPHERTRLTYAEQQTLLEMERHLDRTCPDLVARRAWPWQLVGVLLVLTGAMSIGAVVAAPPADTGVLTIAIVAGVLGVVIGAALAVDPVRRAIRSLPQTLGVARWRRQRLAERLDGADRPAGRWWRRRRQVRRGD